MGNIIIILFSSVSSSDDPEEKRMMIILPVHPTKMKAVFYLQTKSRGPLAKGIGKEEKNY